VLTKLSGNSFTPAIRGREILKLVASALDFPIDDGVAERAGGRPDDAGLLTSDVDLVRLIGSGASEEIRGVDGGHNQRRALGAPRLQLLEFIIVFSDR